MTRDPHRNPWRVSLENCIEGSNYLRSSEYRQLADDIDRLIDERDDALSAVQQAQAPVERVRAGLTAKEISLAYADPTEAHAPSQPVRPVAGECVCGEPWRLGSVHRVDGPCYVAEQQAEPAPEINLADLAAAVNELDTCAARGMAANAAMWKLAAAARSLVGAVDPHKPHFQGSPR